MGLRRAAVHGTGASAPLLVAPPMASQALGTIQTPIVYDPAGVVPDHRCGDDAVPSPLARECEEATDRQGR